MILLILTCFTIIHFLFLPFLTSSVLLYITIRSILVLWYVWKRYGSICIAISICPINESFVCFGITEANPHYWISTKITDNWFDDLPGRERIFGGQNIGTFHFHFLYSIWLCRITTHFLSFICFLFAFFALYPFHDNSTFRYIKLDFRMKETFEWISLPCVFLYTSDLKENIILN